MQYSVRSTGKAEYLYFEEEAVKHVRPSGSGVELRLQYNRDYVSNPSYRWDGLRQQHILTLTKSQTLTVIQQDREAVTWCDGNGTGCYDFDKSASPDGCVRCRLLEALKRGGTDYRQKASEMPLPDTHRGNGLAWAVIILVCLLWWTLAGLASATVQIETLQRQVERVKR